VGSSTVGENGPWLRKVAAYTVQNLFYEISLALSAALCTTDTRDPFFSVEKNMLNQENKTNTITTRKETDYHSRSFYSNV
jgi:hypothetical protein